MLTFDLWAECQAYALKRIFSMIRNQNFRYPSRLEFGRCTVTTAHKLSVYFWRRWLLAQTGTALSVGLYRHINFCLTLSPLLISIHSMTISQPPLTESSVTVIHYYTILLKSILESQWDYHWQLISRPTDEYWLKTSSSLQWSRLAEPHLSTINRTGGHADYLRAETSAWERGLMR